MYSSVSDNNNFFAEQSAGSGYGCRAYGELSHFVYCILRKIKRSESLPFVENWEDYMLPNHSPFAAVDEELFLVGTRIHAALEKMSSPYLKKEIRSNPVAFLKNSAVPSCQPWPPDQNWVRELAVSVLR